MQGTKQLVAVYGCILNHNKEMLIVQRAHHDTHPGMWELPGGAVEHGENPEDAVMREVKEETGLTITPLYPFATATGFSSKGAHIQVVRIAFLCQLTEANQPVQLSHEHMSYQWIPLTSQLDIKLSDLLEKSLGYFTSYPYLFSNENR